MKAVSHPRSVEVNTKYLQVEDAAKSACDNGDGQPLSCIVGFSGFISSFVPAGTSLAVSEYHRVPL